MHIKIAQSNVVQNTGYLWAEFAISHNKTANITNVMEKLRLSPS